MTDIIERIRNLEIKEEIKNLIELIETFYENYKETNSQKLRLIDTFILFSLAIFGVQFIYVFFNGLDPMNSFLSGIMACIGTAIFVLIYLIPCYTFIYSNIKKTNQLILAQNYIFEKLIITSSSIADLNCFISGCKFKNLLDTSKLADYNIIHDIIQGLNAFPKISEFYNEKFLLNACKAAFTNETSEDYINCQMDPIILTAVNTENLLKLVDDLIRDIRKEQEIKGGNAMSRKTLFQSDYYYKIDTIFFKYFLTVEKNFIDCINVDLNNYIQSFYVTSLLLISSFGLIIILFYLLSRIILIKNLIHHLSISRMIMKIIPTSIIINTPELESWIESKY